MIRRTETMRSWAESADRASKPQDDRLMRLIIARIKARQTINEGKEDMTALGTTEYHIEPWNGSFKVISAVWNTGMFGAPQWHRNQVAICDTVDEAEELIAKLEASTKNPG